ncbi:hypothetical protein [Streptomyces reniochalinae]|uniref:Uncharacterized protein n=1 Tax=Streptomyces reniochalinae TaxID=2250578 RepID=A0A367EVT3_9ACTN|nr:hypothetical protein [Streptomyces reniochalinae]RCG21742.1 hypothetical protein DQ392_08520 [Streptomyces reniochalinae]
MPTTKKELDASANAEAQEAEATGHYVTAELCGKEVEVVPAGAWRQSAMRMLREGDFDAFFGAVMSPDSYELYLDLDPTNDEINDFMEMIGDRSGETLGKSSGRRPSSRNTRRR